MNNLRKILFASMMLFSLSAIGAKNASMQVDPPYWWTGMNNHSVQLMVNRENIRDAQTSVNYPGVTIDSIVRMGSRNYQLVYLNISDDAKPGIVPITFTNGKKKEVLKYELKQRGEVHTQTFSSEDLLYLIMPDRFADGDESNNEIASMNHSVKVNRENPNARHGGDLKGIADHLGYIDSLGVTAIWLTPVLENDMRGGSYHGYATTNYYRVDPRFGTNAEYRDLIAKSHKRGIKVVMDMIFNHCGIDHKWLKDLPDSTWLNHPNADVMTNFRLSTINDPYKSDYDYDKTVNGWFVKGMPDLNQRNPHVLTYLIQSSIFWIEDCDIDGIRMDTYPYADMEQMAKWIAAVENEYPGFNIVGEAWYGEAAGTAYWQKGSRLNQRANTNLRTVMDFPTMIMATKAFTEPTLPWAGGLNEIYNRLSLDYLYENPKNVLVFLENHDSDRFLLEMPKDLGSFKQAMTFLLTSRGIPQLYYGSELLMNGSKEGSDGYVRRDMKGGFRGDSINQFTEKGREGLYKDAWNFVRTLANWRRGNKAVSDGTLKHFMPDNGLYVYERHNGNRRFIVIMNGNDSQAEDVDMSRYAEIMKAGDTFQDVPTKAKITIKEKMTFAPREVLILECF